LKLGLKACLAILAVLYPIAVGFGLKWFEPRWIALCLVLLALARLALGARDRFAVLGAGIAGFVAAWTWLGNHPLALKLYPVLVSLGFLSAFAWSLVFPPTVIERLARIAEPDLPDAALPYVRRVTQVWCGFFVINAAIALWTALAASDAVWTLYNGCLSYIAIGLLFAGEWLVRQRVKRRIAAGEMTSA